MNIIDDNINIKKMYDYQLNKIDNSDYENYIKYLGFFFTKNSKKNKYDKEFLNGEYILIDKNDTNKKIKITPSKFINIHKLYYSLKNESNSILIKISNLIENNHNITEDDRKEFDFLKIKYQSFKEKINDINIINQNFYNEMQELIQQKIEKSNKLYIYYQKRRDEYKSINTMISEKLKNDLIVLFNNNNKKILNDKEINKISKDNGIPSEDIEKWLKWIEYSYLYILLKDELNKLNNEIKQKDNDFDLNTNYMIIKRPIIS